MKQAEKMKAQRERFADGEITEDELAELLSKIDSTGVLLDETSTALRALVVAHLEASA